MQFCPTLDKIIDFEKLVTKKIMIVVVIGWLGTNDNHATEEEIMQLVYSSQNQNPRKI